MWRERLQDLVDDTESRVAARSNGGELVQISSSGQEGSFRSETAAQSPALVNQPTWAKTVADPGGSAEATSDSTLSAVFASLLSYPDSNYKQSVNLCAGALDATDDLASFEPFAEFVHAESLAGLEEQWVATFEMTTRRPLEIGWHLYGEQYKRGEFLVKMRKMLRNHNVQEKGELPDHLSHCLLLLPRMHPLEAGAFLAGYLLPALRKLIEGFREKNPYYQLLLTLEQLLGRSFSRTEEQEGEA